MLQLLAPKLGIPIASLSHHAGLPLPGLLRPSGRHAASAAAAAAAAAAAGGAVAAGATGGRWGARRADGRKTWENMLYIATIDNEIR